MHPEVRAKNIIEKLPHIKYNIKNGYGGVKDQNEVNKGFLKNNNVANIVTNKTNMGRRSNINGEIWKKRGTNSVSQTAEIYNENKENIKKTEGLEESSSFNLQKDNTGRELTQYTIQ